MFLFIFWLRWVFASDWGPFFIVVRGLLIAVVSAIAERGL